MPSFGSLSAVSSRAEGLGGSMKKTWRAAKGKLPQKHQGGDERKEQCKDGREKSFLFYKSIY